MPPESATKITILEILGERLCLDFINTVDPRVGPQQRDFLTSFADLVAWGVRAGLLAEAEALATMNAAAQEPDRAKALFQRAILLRETLYRIFIAIVERRAPSADDLATLHDAYVEVVAQAHLIAGPDSVAWEWPEASDALEQLLAPIVRSAVELLTSPEAERVKVCPGLGDCGWLFLDARKSGRRRWCSMSSCGSRAKMRRYYARTHAGAHADQT
jgi:predicted RNA-binding Zn ribbon-like protein